jgi:hypothetical protein
MFLAADKRNEDVHLGRILVCVVVVEFERIAYFIKRVFVIFMAGYLTGVAVRRRIVVAGTVAVYERVD